LQVLGNVLYYRFVNPAIIAPEAFGVIEMSLKDTINAIQRRNLASIARVLQFAASGQKVLGSFFFFFLMAATHDQFTAV
jgi:hypothetical protein